MFERNPSVSWRAVWTASDGGAKRVEIRAWMRQRGGQWVAGIHGDPAVRASAATRQRCLLALRRSLERPSRESTAKTSTTLLVEVLPALAGVAEAAEVMGWDKRRVITYLDRGRFPEPVQSLASGRVWLRADVERYAAEWHARQSDRRRKTPG
jgi:hypothetical protein